MKSALLCSALGMAALAAPARADVVTIDVSLPGPAAGSYRLIGQSAFVLTTLGGASSGGQLEGLESPGGSISYTEIFPPATFSDYQSFGFFGRIETLDDTGDVIDTSLIVGLRDGAGLGATIDSVLGGPDEATLVAALGTFDSPEFLDLLGTVSSDPLSLGLVELPPIGRGGETLTLVAFTAGPDGDLGAAVGTLTTSIVPGPSAAGLGIAVLGLSARRKR